METTRKGEKVTKADNCHAGGSQGDPDFFEKQNDKSEPGQGGGL